MSITAIVPAAGRGTRMGADKALLVLGDRTAIEHVVGQCLQAGVDELLVVRAARAAPLPPLPEAARVVTVSGDGEMKDSLCAALAAADPSAGTVVVFPVDHALVAAETVAAVAAAVQRDPAAIALPLYRGKPGHPLALRRQVAEELQAPGVTSLREIVRRDPARVRAVPSANPWVLADLDRPEDLRAARAALTAEGWCVVEQMHRHRSRRAYAPAPLLPGQLERLVDAARRASTSSFIQAYSVIAVADAARKQQVASLCADQQHIRQAPVFLAICADLHKIASACQRHGAVVQTQSFELFLQATVDAALLGQNLQLAAESEGLGACMIGAARNHPLELARLLLLPQYAYVLFGMTIGHATDDPLQRGRMPLDGVLHHETYDQGRIDAALAGADDEMRAWARRTNAERGGNRGRPVNETRAWTDRMAQLWGEQSAYVRDRARFCAELRELGFGLQ